VVDGVVVAGGKDAAGVEVDALGPGGRVVPAPERLAPVDEVHDDATRTAPSSAYRSDDRGKEIEADMTKTAAKPRWKRSAFMVAGAVAVLATAACSSSVTSGRVSASRTGPTVSTAGAASTVGTTVAPSPPPTEAVRPATTAGPAAVVTSPTGAAACASTLASRLAWTGSARQLVTVESVGYAVQTATVTLWQRSGSCWVVAGGPWAGHIGYNGFSDHKQEGDGKTPTGAYGFGPTVYGIDPNPGVHEAYHVLACGDWWDESPSSSAYNTFQHVNSCSTSSPWGDPDSEALWSIRPAYNSFAVIDYNTSPVIKGAGSAIFFHVSTGGATAGCVSIPLSELDQFLRWMEPSESPLIVMGPSSEITRF
jgi:L,D-peptidoglycan transpeptidase YkuD (ErfK/YbiS/YcfS/YnhG family)